MSDKIVDYEDENGIMRRVKLPDDETDVSLGIPIDLYDILDVTLFEHAPLSFRRAFYKGLWNRGVITPVDLNKRNAIELMMQAYRVAVKFEANDAFKAIKEFMAK